MMFHFVHPEAAGQQHVPPGFCGSPDGRLAIDDPALTRVVKTEPFDAADKDSVEALHVTKRWHPMHGWLPLAKFQEWAQDSVWRPSPEATSASAAAAEEAKND